MNNFSNDSMGYNKDEVNSFVEYVIKKTEDNVLTIKKQNEEIDSLRKEIERLKRLEDSYNYVQNQIENMKDEMISNAKYEADLILNQARDNASMLVNDALVKAEKLQKDNENLSRNVKNYKRKLRNIILEQLDSIDDIEVL